MKGFFIYTIKKLTIKKLRELRAMNKYPQSLLFKT